MKTFPSHERLALLEVKGVGPTVVRRLEEMGYHSLESLSSANTLDIVTHTAAALGASCWKNSPQARASIDGAISLAKTYVSKE